MVGTRPIVRLPPAGGLSQGLGTVDDGDPPLAPILTQVKARCGARRMIGLRNFSDGWLLMRIGGYRFVLLSFLTGWIALFALPDTVRAAERFALISVQSGKYVRAGGGQESLLGAVSDRIADWETFERVPIDGTRVAIRAVLSGKYVRAGVGQESLLAAVSDRIAAWETFTYVVVPSNVDIIQPAPVPVTPGPEPADQPSAGSQPPPQPAPGGGVAPEMQQVLSAHNNHRDRHCVPALTWSPALAAQAQAWANQCNFVHSSSGYGENLWMGTAGYYSPTQVVDSWYAEIANYQYSQPGFSGSTGHFTQIVWKSSTQLGCGRATCQGNDLWVCNYAPPGNYQGQFPQNVLPPC